MLSFPFSAPRNEEARNTTRASAAPRDGINDSWPPLAFTGWERDGITAALDGRCQGTDRTNIMFTQVTGHSDFFIMYFCSRHTIVILTAVMTVVKLNLSFVHENLIYILLILFGTTFES